MKQQFPVDVFFRQRMCVELKVVKGVSVLESEVITVKSVDENSVHYTYKGKDKVAKRDKYGFKVGHNSVYFSDFGLPFGTIVGPNAQKFIDAVFSF